MQHKESRTPSVTSADDSLLVVRAQDGQRQAFDILVRRYSDQALQWATRLTKDVHLAEDAVQEAWIRAYTHLETLRNPERFGSWLRRIVYNQVMMKLRHRGSNGKEYSMSAFADLTNEADSDRMVATGMHDSDEPSVVLARAEDEERIRMAIDACLKPRDRQMFQAHYLSEVSLDEISEQFAISLSNTYQIISRSRLKLRKHLVTSAVLDYLRIRRNLASSTKESVGSLMYVGEFWSSAGLCLSWILQYQASSAWAMDEIMALSGHAFQLCVHAERVDYSGILAWPWGEKFVRGLFNLGFQARYVGGRTCATPGPDQFVQALNLIHESIDHDSPCIIWDSDVPHFSIVTSYDDAASVIGVLGFEGFRTVRYDELGKGRCGRLFVVAIGSKVHINRVNSLRRTLHTAILHGVSLDAPMQGYVHGLQAYDAWIRALHAAEADAEGNAFTAAMTAESRRYAAEFLARVSIGWLPSIPMRSRIERLCMYASLHYMRAADALYEVRKLFPYPHYGDPFGTHSTKCAIAYLEQAKNAETRALRVLQRIVHHLDAYL